MKSKSKISPFLIGMLLLMSAVNNLQAQEFINGNLEGEVVGSSTLPSGWQSIPPSAFMCNASSTNQASPDLSSFILPDEMGGIIGNPQSGNTFISGLRAGNGAFEFDEGIQQSVVGFVAGETYEISFFQTIVKQINGIDESGFWRVFVDDVFIGDTDVITSSLPFNSTLLVWDECSISFAATSNTHLIRFIPRDDDFNLNLSDNDILGALRMGIDNISIVLPDPAFDVTLNNVNICSGECVDLEVLSNIEINSFQWDNNILENANLVNVCPTQTTIYTVFVTSVSGDTATLTSTVNVSESPVINESGFIEVCDGPVELNAGNIGSDFLWQDNSSDQFYSVETSGNYSVMVSNNECLLEHQFEVWIHDIEAEFIVENTTGCSPLKTSFSNTSSNTVQITEWHWDFGDSLQSAHHSPSHYYAESGIYEVTLDVFTSIGCQASVSEIVEIIVYEQPTAAFSVFPIEAEILKEINFQDESNDAAEWSWSFGNGFSSAEQNPSQIFEEAGDYPISLTVSNSICTDNIQLWLHVTEHLILYVPSSFTPDEDGLNDFLFPVIAGADENDYLFQIYNRVGEIVFETRDINEKWNGIPRNGVSHYSIDGIYNWKIKVKETASSEKMEFYGSTLMMR